MTEPKNESNHPENPSKLFLTAMIVSVGVGIVFWGSLALILFWALRH